MIAAYEIQAALGNASGTLQLEWRALNLVVFTVKSYISAWKSTKSEPILIFLFLNHF